MLHDVVFAGSQGPCGRSEFGSAAQERLDGGRVAAADSAVQRPHAVQVDVFEDGALLQQDLHDLGVAAGGGQVERRAAAFVGRVDVGVLVEQGDDGVTVAADARPTQGRRSFLVDAFDLRACNWPNKKNTIIQVKNSVDTIRRK